MTNNEQICPICGNSSYCGWVNIEDELPEKMVTGQFKHYFVYNNNNNNNVMVAKWLFNKFYIGSHPIEPTHWMPFPDKPFFL